jgi:WD40 repeat protein
MSADGASKAPPRREAELGAFVVGVAFDGTGSTLAAATGAGAMHLLAADPSVGDAPRMVELHRGAALGFARHPDGKSFVSAGDDGRLVRATCDGGVEDLLTIAGKWIDAVATHGAKNLIAAVVGREIHLLGPSGARVLAPHPSSVAAIAFSPDGTRLAAAHYGGVAIWLTQKAGESAKKLNWKGSHVAVAYSPNGRLLATGTQDNAIHFWRLASGADAQMQGFLAKARSLAWSADSNWLTSSGADTVVAWGFAGKGPEGMPPLELQPSANGVLLTQVCAHPAAPFIAFGGADGAVEIADLEKKRVMPLAGPCDSPVSALAWSPDGWRLAAGTESGKLRCFELKPRG